MNQPLFRGPAIRHLVEEVAQLVSETNGFDSEEQTQLGCRTDKPRIVMVGRSVNGQPFVLDIETRITP